MYMAHATCGVYGVGCVCLDTRYIYALCAYIYVRYMRVCVCVCAVCIYTLFIYIYIYTYIDNIMRVYKL